MKKYYINIICVTLLIPALFFCSLSTMPAEDEDMNGLIVLEDVILSIRSLADGGDGTASFRTDFSRAMSSLNIAAGLKTVIKASEKPLNSISFQWVYLIALSCTLSCITCLFEFFQRNFFYRSYMLPPDFPPPRIC